MGAAYSVQLNAGGGALPYAWSLTSGSLAPGLKLLSASGTISGTPTAQGGYTFTVAVQDSSPTPQTKTQVLTLEIDTDNSLAMATSALSDASPNMNYGATLQATGGVAPLTWTLMEGALPTGLALTGSGSIAGDPRRRGAIPSPCR